MALFGVSWVGPEEAMISTRRGPPRMLLAETGRGPEWTMGRGPWKPYDSAKFSFGFEQFLGSKSQTKPPNHKIKPSH